MFDLFTGSMSPLYLAGILAIQIYKVWRDHKPKADPLQEFLDELRKLFEPAAPPAPAPSPADPAAAAGIVSTSVPVQFRVTPNVEAVRPPGS